MTCTRFNLRRTVLIAGVAVGTIAPAASAETLREALLQAYRSNPTITGQRAGVRALDENVPIARAAGLSSFGISGGYDENLLRDSNSFVSPARSASAAATLSVPIYSGGAVRSSVRAARTRVEAGEIGLRGTEASLFT